MAEGSESAGANPQTEVADESTDVHVKPAPIWAQLVTMAPACVCV